MVPFQEPPNTAEPLRESPDAMTILQLTMGLAGLAAALAAISYGQGPLVYGIPIVPAGLLLVGMPAFFGAIFSMVALWEECGLTRQHMWGRYNGESIPTTIYRALLLSHWAILFLGIFYVLLTIMAARPEISNDDSSPKPQVQTYATPLAGYTRDERDDRDSQWILVGTDSWGPSDDRNVRGSDSAAFWSGG